MIRKFSKLKDIATLKNNGDKTVGVVPYGSRTVGTGILPNEEFEFEISSASKSLYYYKQQTDSIEAVGLYDDEDEPSTKLSFETVPFDYSNLTEEQKEQVDEGEVPLFAFTNIQSRDLNDNEVYLTSNVYIDLNVNQTIRTNPVYHSGEYNYRGVVFEVTSDVVFDSHYVIEREGSLKDEYFHFDFYEEGETEKDPVTCKYDINLYIAEKRVDGDDTYYTIKEKATNTINAYFLGRVGFSIIKGDWEYGVDKSKISVEFYDNEGTAQVVNWQSSESNDGPNLTNLLYGHNYRVHAESSDSLLVIDGVGEDGVDIQDTTINYPQDTINFSKTMRVLIINNHIKPVYNVYVKDEASDVFFALYKMNGSSTVGIMVEGQSLEIGQEYSVGFSTMPLPGQSNIYINGNLVASGVRYYRFTLTADLVVDNQVVIKVLKAAYLTYYRDMSSSVDFILTEGKSSIQWVNSGDAVYLDTTYAIRGSMTNMFILPPSDIYINDIMVAENVSYHYGFTLTDEMVVDKMVIIKVMNHGGQPVTSTLTVDNTQGNVAITVTGDPNVNTIYSASIAKVSTNKNTNYQFNATFNGTVYFNGTYNGQEYPKGTELKVDEDGYIYNPPDTGLEWQAGAEGTMTIVSTK